MGPTWDRQDPGEPHVGPLKPCYLGSAECMAQAIMATEYLMPELTREWIISLQLFQEKLLEFEVKLAERRIRMRDVCIKTIAFGMVFVQRNITSGP